MGVLTWPGCPFWILWFKSRQLSNSLAPGQRNQGHQTQGQGPHRGPSSRLCGDLGLQQDILSRKYLTALQPLHLRSPTYFRFDTPDLSCCLQWFNEILYMNHFSPRAPGKALAWRTLYDWTAPPNRCRPEAVGMSCGQPTSTSCKQTCVVGSRANIKPMRIHV